MKTKRYTFIFLFLVAIALTLWNYKNTSETSDVEEDFAVEHPENVQMIFMTNQTGDEQIYLKKQADGSWTVNDQFPAAQNKVDFLLNETMAKITIQGPTPANAVSNVLSYMSIHGVKVEAYENVNEPPVKTYIVGNTTPTQLGTYFKFPGNSEPKILHIPGFNGFVNSRYSLKEDDWISRRIFGSKKEDIRSIHVQYPDTTRSFKIEQPSEETLTFTSAIISPENKNNGAIKSYLNLFEKLNYETFVYTKDSRLKDSLLLATPFCTITVESANRGMDEIKFYRKASYDKMHGLYDDEGNMLAYDPDRYYALYNKLGRVLIVQDYTFQKVLLEAKDFKNRTE